MIMLCLGIFVSNWHLQPRYDHDVIFENQVFKDPNFGYYALNNEKPQLLKNEIQNVLCLKIKEKLEISD